MRCPPRRCAGPLLASAVLSALPWISSASAQTQTLYWDMNNNFPGATDDPSNKAGGQWNRTLTNWSTDPNGQANTGPWIQGSRAVFAASNDATAAYVVPISNNFTPQTAGIAIEEADITFEGIFTGSNTPSTITLTGAGEINVPSGRIATFNTQTSRGMRFSGSVGLTKTGSGEIRLLNGGWDNLYTGPTRILGGLLSISKETHLGAVPSTATAGNIVLGGNGTLHVPFNTTISSNRGMTITTGGGTLSTNHNLTVNYNGIIADDPAAPGQTLTRATGSSTWTLGGNNTFTGPFNLSSGTLILKHASALGSTTGGTSLTTHSITLGLEGVNVGNEALTINGTGFSGRSGALVNLSGDSSWGGTITLGNQSSSFTISSDAGTFNLTNAVSVTGTSGKSLILNGAGDGVVGGSLNHAAALTKNGTGKWTLNGNNAFTGATTVNAGKLIVNGTYAAAAARTTVKSGATLGGSGQVRDVTIESGGILAPGGSTNPGTFNARELILGSTSSLDFELGTTSDRIALTGNLTLDGLLNITDAGGLAPGTYRLIDYTGTLNNQGLALGTIPSGFTMSISTATANQVNLDVQFTVIPEPGAVSVLAMGALLLVRRSR